MDRSGSFCLLRLRSDGGQSPHRKLRHVFNNPNCSPNFQDPALHGFKVYSQSDEDGIIEHIFGRLPQLTKTFIKIGCGNGLENNFHFLVLKGYKGSWVDGNAEKIACIVLD
jgi:hypothetical protein